MNVTVLIHAEHHIHFIAHAFHRGDKLPPNSVTCIHVTENEDKERPSPRRFGPLALVAMVGFAMSMTLVGMSVYFAGKCERQRCQWCA